MEYEVTLKEIEIYVVTVEAANEEEARNAAWEKLTEDGNKYKYHHDSDGESEAIEVE